MKLECDEEKEEGAAQKRKMVGRVSNVGWR
jgi:hypothetical protein